MGETVWWENLFPQLVKNAIKAANLHIDFLYKAVYRKLAVSQTTVILEILVS